MAWPVTRWRDARLVGAAALLLAAALSGCASTSDDTTGASFVSAGTYTFYTCDQLATYIKATRTKLTETEQLMARSAQGAGGEFVNAIAYRTEYMRLRGELKVLMDTARAKNCAVLSPWTSERSVF
jgi:hypothetical protein